MCILCILFHVITSCNGGTGLRNGEHTIYNFAFTYSFLLSSSSYWRYQLHQLPYLTPSSH